MLDVHLFLNPRMKLHQNGTVSFSIKLAAPQASGWADTWPPIPAYPYEQIKFKEPTESRPGFGGSVMNGQYANDIEMTRISDEVQAFYDQRPYPPPIKDLIL